MLTRRSFLGGLGATGMGAAPPMPPAAGERPNVVIILSDDQGWGDVGCYGAEDAQTPHLDALAASGVRLLDFYANAPMCSPTRAALLTGRYPYRCGVPFVVDSRPGKRGLAGDEITIAEILRGQGYRTGLIGKWHLGSHRDSLPNNQGFDDFFGFRAGCVDYYSHRFYWGLGAGLPSFHDLWRNEREIDESGAYATDLITRESVRFIEEQGGGPFFLVVSYNAPHYPMHAPREYLERFPPDMDPERRMHLALCAAMDDGIGRIAATLERKGLRENTLVFFQSDNGATIEDRAGLGGRNAPFRGFKFSLFEGGIRVPAVASWPGVLPAGETRSQPAASMDLFPAIAALCAADPPAARVIDGRNIWPMLAENAPSPHERLFWKRYDQAAVREGDWKLVVNGILALGEEHALQGRDRVFLSNLAEDPREIRNLAGREPRIVENLRRKLRQWELDVQSGG